MTTTQAPPNGGARSRTAWGLGAGSPALRAWMVLYAVSDGNEPCASDPEMWWPHSYSSADARDARVACRDCPVIAECLEYALIAGEPEGIWGATIPAERKRMRRRANLPPPQRTRSPI